MKLCQTFPTSQHCNVSACREQDAAVCCVLVKSILAHLNSHSLTEVQLRTVSPGSHLERQVVDEIMNNLANVVQRHLKSKQSLYI